MVVGEESASPPSGIRALGGRFFHKSLKRVSREAVAGAGVAAAAAAGLAAAAGAGLAAAAGAGLAPAAGAGLAAAAGAGLAVATGAASAFWHARRHCVRM